MLGAQSRFRTRCLLRRSHCIARSLIARWWWLAFSARARIHAEGSRFRPRVLVERVTGEAPSARPFLAYLEKKYAALYG